MVKILFRHAERILEVTYDSKHDSIISLDQAYQTVDIRIPAYVRND